MTETDITEQTVLLVGTDDWATDQVRTALTESGLHVLGCHERGEAPFPCNAFREGRQCPLDAGFDVAVTVRARPSPKPQAAEIGAICALRTGRPLIVAGVTADNPFESVAEEVPECMDLAAACRMVVRRATPASAGRAGQRELRR